MSDSDNLKKILEDSFRDLFNRDNTARKLYGKIKQNKATYKDAQLFARRVGELAANAFRDSTSPDMFPALDNQQALIESVLGLLRVDHEIVSEATAVVQKTINTRAGLGLNAVVPNMDVDRAEGIARNIAEQEDKDAAVARMNTMADNYSQHVVDESIRQNANFQWKSGMSPKIVRTAEARSCKWCRALAGTYEYSEVSDTGNDVFRRHENCNCTVEFVADGKHAQDVWSKASYRYKDSADRVRSQRAIEDYREGLRQAQQERRIARSKDIERVQRELGYSSKGAAIWYNKNKDAIERNGLDFMLTASKDGKWLSKTNPYKSESFRKSTNTSYRVVTQEYLDVATPKRGNIDYDKGFVKKKSIRETVCGEVVFDTFGGDIKYRVPNNNEKGVKNPDYLWNGSLWELKSCSTEKAPDAAIRKALQQIEANAGGIVMELAEDVNTQKALETVERRMRRPSSLEKLGQVDVMIIKNGVVIAVLRYG